MPNPNDNENRALIQSGYRYALSLTNDEHNAEDLIQQACLRVLRSRGTLVSRSYLLTAVRNLFIDHSRRTSSKKEERLVETDIATPSAHEQQVDRRDDIEHMLAKLRSEEREVLYLHCVENYSAKEIGLLIGSPRGTVLSLLSRARNKLSGGAPEVAKNGGGKQ